MWSFGFRLIHLAEFNLKHLEVDTGEGITAASKDTGSVFILCHIVKAEGFATPFFFAIHEEIAC